MLHAADIRPGALWLDTDGRAIQVTCTLPKIYCCTRHLTISRAGVTYVLSQAHLSAKDHQHLAAVAKFYTPMQRLLLSIICQKGMLYVWPSPNIL